MSTDTHPEAEDSSPKEEELVNRRMRKIQEYQVESLANVDPLRANLGAEAGNLMRMGLRLEQVIDKALSKSTDAPRELKRLAAVMDTYLKVTRQWDRLVQLDTRLANGQKRG
jgi:hypothetical protein